VTALLMHSLHYQAIGCFARIVSGYGGVLTYLADGLDFEILKVQHALECESIWLKVKLGNTWLIIANIYRPPKSNASIFVETLERELAGKRNFVLAGDFNLNVAQPQKLLTDFIARNSLRQLVTGATFIQSQTTIDLVITDADYEISVAVGLSIGSDHLPIVAGLHLEQTTVRNRKANYIQIRAKYEKMTPLQKAFRPCVIRSTYGIQTMWTTAGQGSRRHSQTL
jgi:hypothetical protein